MILISVLFAGSIAVIPVFVRTGTDLLLDVKEPVTLNDSDLTWKYNGNKNIAKVSSNNERKIYRNDENRAVVFGNCSLLLKNVRQSDNGMYRAQTSGDEDKIVAEYAVTVQGKFNILNVDTQPYSVSKPSHLFFFFSSRSSVSS